MGKIIFYIVFSRVQAERHFRAIFGALGYSRAGTGCDAAADRLKAPVLGQRALLPYVPLRFHPSESVSAAASQPVPVRDHLKATKNGFGGFVVNARMELERKVKKGLTKTGQVW